MKIRPRKIGWTLGLLLIPAVTGAVAAATAPESTIVGRLVDVNGASIAGATVLVFPAATGRIASDSVQLRTDADGGFLALLPPGRYMVAAVKRGYEVSMTEVHSVASRVLRMRLRPSPPAGRRLDIDLGADLVLGGQRADVLRDEVPILAPAVFISRTDDDGPIEGPGTGPRAATVKDPARALLGTLDGEIVQSLGAGEILGLEAGAPLDAERATALSLRAPIRPGVGWQLDGQSLRSRSDMTAEDTRLAGRSDRMAFTVARTPVADERLRGSLRAGYGSDSAGAFLVRDGFVQGSGDLGYDDKDSRLAFAMQAWGSRSGEGDQTQATGMAFYAGDRRALGRQTRLDYGVEYRGDSLSGQGRIVPRIGMTRQAGVESPLMVSTEILLDPARPGGRVSVEGRPGNVVQLAASVSVIPANAAAVSDDASHPAQAVWGLAPAGVRTSDQQEVDLSLSRDFGPMSGSVTGSLGRTGHRSVPVVDQGPLPVVSYGDERYYETRLGIAYRPWSTEMQLGYRCVTAEAEAAPEQTGVPQDYRRFDLVVSQGLPSPRALLGARLHALVAWQGLEYGTVYSVPGGAPLSGLASRLTGGVGLSF